MPSAVYERRMESLLMELLLTAKQRKHATVSMDRKAEEEAVCGRIHTSLEVRYWMPLPSLYVSPSFNFLIEILHAD